MPTIPLHLLALPGAAGEAARAIFAAQQTQSQRDLKNALEQAISDKEIGIILLTEKFGREFPEIIDEVRLHHKTPLIIEIPDRHGTGRKPDFITSYVNEAIGLKL